MYRIGQEEINEVAKVIESKKLFKINTALKETENAELELKQKFECNHSILMTSGHAALTSALIALGVGPGDQVIVPAYTYIATAMVVVGVGAIPVLAEVDETLTLDPADFERKITKNTKAVIPVHIQGFPCDMDAIMKIAKKYNVAVVEDACQADGGSYKGKRLGTIGDAGALSFNYFKIISCGEGGALLTNDKGVFERALIYHDSNAVAYFGDQLNGVEERLFCGSEYRTNEISSAILRKQIEKLDGILTDLRNFKQRLIADLDGLYNFIKSNDIDGDCGTTLAIRFNSYEEGKAFAEKEGVNGWTPIETGKHVYKNWTPIMNKVGAYHPLLDPFKMEANKDIIPDYKEDMCPKTLDHLAKTVYIAINPDWTEEQYQKVLTALKNAK